MPRASIRVEKFRTKRQNELLKLLKDSEVTKTVNGMVAKAINNELVPMKSGKLRKSMRFGPRTISWGRGLKYARYQYWGEIYGPNIPGAINGNPAWISGKKKYPTGRMMGDFTGDVDLKPRWQRGEPKVTGTLTYHFGYTTPGTRYQWDKGFKYGIKRKTNLEITQYLKRECKARGLRI